MRNWQDFFYFSSSERRALIFLSVLIIGIGAVLWFTEKEDDECNEVHTTASIHTAPVTFNTKDTIPQQSEVLTKKKVIRDKRSFKTAFSSPKKNYTLKFTEKVVIELNHADTILLQKVPGIGSSFSKRIVKYRALLGGFYSVEQLAEVYGIDEERFEKLAPWFRVDSSFITPLPVNDADFRTLIRHPYLNKQQTVAILDFIKRNGKLSGWNDLKLLEEFTKQDIQRLKPYFTFE